MDPRPAVPTPSDPRPQPADPFAGLAEKFALLDTLPVAERVPVFGAIHTTLNEALALTAAGGDQPPVAPAPQRPAGQPQPQSSVGSGRPRHPSASQQPQPSRHNGGFRPGPGGR